MHIGLRRPLPSVYAHAMRIAFMGTPDFAVPTLDALVSAGHDVVAVYSQPPRPAGRGKAARPSPVHARAEALGLPVHTPVRSEAHTSELQSLMRISYAVFCLKKKIKPSYIQHLDSQITIVPTLIPYYDHANPYQT